jgi:hypothetical protein
MNAQVKMTRPDFAAAQGKLGCTRHKPRLYSLPFHATKSQPSPCPRENGTICSIWICASMLNGCINFWDTTWHDTNRSRKAQDGSADRGDMQVPLYVWLITIPPSIAALLSGIAGILAVIRAEPRRPPGNNPGHEKQA